MVRSRWRWWSTTPRRCGPTSAPTPGSGRCAPARWWPSSPAEGKAPWDARRAWGAVQLAGLGLLVAPALFYESTLAYPGVVALAPVGGTLCLLAGGELATTALPGRLLASRPLVGLGRVSYAWYLWHWPLMVLGGVLVPGIGPAGMLAWGFAGLLAALLTHRLLERPAVEALLERATAARGESGGTGEPRIPETVWTEGLRRTYSRLTQLGIEVIVLRGLPWVPFDVPSCLSRRAARLPMATDCRFVPDRAFMARAQRAQDRAARGLPVRFLDMNDRVCGGGAARCATERDGVVLFMDDNHITGSFSRFLGTVLGERLDAALRRQARPPDRERRAAQPGVTAPHEVNP